MLTYYSSPTPLHDHLLGSILVAQVHAPQIYLNLVVEVLRRSCQLILVLFFAFIVKQLTLEEASKLHDTSVRDELEIK